MRVHYVYGAVLGCWFWAILIGLCRGQGEPLPGTQPLTLEGDIASLLVEGVDRFLLHQLAGAPDERTKRWTHGCASWEDYQKWLASRRERLAHILGVRDERVPFESPQLDATVERPAQIGRGFSFDIHAIRWPALGDVHGEGLLLVPRQGSPLADVVAIPDADVTPEMLVGLEPGLAAEEQYARRLAESGCRVVVPVLIDRHRERRNGRANLTSREFIYRSAFELGRHIIGYEIQKVLAAVDWYEKQSGGRRPCGVMGWGEGGMLALYCGALDPRIDAVAVTGYFDAREGIWTQPIDRNVLGLLELFGDAELAAMVAPRALVIEAARGPEVEIPTGEGGAPGRLATPPVERVKAEFARAQKIVASLQPSPSWHLVLSGNGQGPFGTAEALEKFLSPLGASLAQSGPMPVRLAPLDIAARQARQLHELDRHNQQLLVESPYVRQQFMSKLDFTSLETYQKSVEPYREYFRKEIIGEFPNELLPPNPRTRCSYQAERWTGYEVVLDVFPDVIAYGILLVPKGMRSGERRPVVVCQHGLEGRPQDVIQGDHPAYHDFAARLADRGFVTFAPQNLYIFQDRFRTLQRKANPLKKTLFSIMVPQHRQIVRWLKSLPFVDGERIAFYGLSYGGKSAMRIPPLVEEYCLSICSADFNEWVWKNASSRAPYSYVWTGEYEIFEFDLGSTFNYAEMAALIAPRPFMVERGHFDGVAPDETVAYEFAKVRHLYQARLKLQGRCEIEWFVGPHTINGQGTFAFLHRHLQWPLPP